MSRNRRGSKPKQSNSKPRTRREDAKEEDIKKSGNDPAWYAADPQIMRDAASIPFSWPTGNTELHDMSLYGSNVVRPAQVPGVLSLKVNPAVGAALRATDAINVASQSVYSFVRHANSGHSNYDAPDLMIYILAMSNMYSALVWCQRLYGYALTYDQRNRYIPNSLIAANGVNASDLVNNLADFRFWINTLIAKMASFAVPGTMSIFSRMSFMYSDFYCEGSTIKDQLYQYVPAGFYKFGLDSDQKGQLTFVPLPSSAMTVSDIRTYVNDMFNAIWSQEDFGIMSGDILKAYGDNIIKLVSLPEAYMMVPKFDIMVLTQMKNADIIHADPVRIGQSGGLITQALIPSGYSTSDKTVSGTALTSAQVTKVNQAMNTVLKDYRILTVGAEDPSPEIVMEATRCKAGYDAYLGELKVASEFISGVLISHTPAYNLEYGMFIICDTLADERTAFTRVAISSMFEYAPKIRVLMDISSTNWQLDDFFEVDNFAILNNADVSKMHEAAVVNMYAVPSIGKVL